MPRFFLARHAAAVVCAGFVLAGCNTAPNPSAQQSSAEHLWSGRLGLQVDDPAAQAQSFSASFQLQGSVQQGSLQLYSPLGSQVAQLEWLPGAAQLRQGNQVTDSTSLPELLQLSLGTALPIEALFSWLQGIPVAAPGWQVDLSRHAQGRITAQRTTPLPQTSLRVVLH